MNICNLHANKEDYNYPTIVKKDFFDSRILLLSIVLLLILTGCNSGDEIIAPDSTNKGIAASEPVASNTIKETDTPEPHSSVDTLLEPTPSDLSTNLEIIITYPTDFESEHAFAEDENYIISGYLNRGDAKSLSYVVENDSGNGVREKYLEDSVDLNKLDSDTIIFAIDSIYEDIAPWDIYLKLKPNKNYITITATDKNGNIAEKKIETYYEAETVIDETFTIKYYNVCINKKEMKALPGGGYSLTLNWDSIYAEGTKYAILKETSDGRKDVVAKGLIEKSYTDTNVKPNERYKYTVQAEIEPGEYEYSNKLILIFKPDSDGDGLIEEEKS